ncbi:hypothetical protein [Prochlorococcus marinus]|uniref:hypothetical protein n=1 Tax=Prochlorococcus marinus TaxID=1219 RepID=UPI0022B30FEE|nr:hypothetical protein [Prochlorococcus marinus]
MNDPISWDPSLVKKFSTSNHYKLLNQLRSEVKKYPLNNKKKGSTIESNDTNLDNKNKSNITHIQNSAFSNKSNVINDANSNKSTVSFNNAKNFSIHNKMNNNISRKNDGFLPEQIKSNEDSSPPTFKERLNQIDMK